jgi:hypothetical protein
MKDIAREKYLRLMERVEELEERVMDLERELLVAGDSPDPQDAEVVRDELRGLQEELAANRTELTRISNGCGTPRA